MKWMTLTAALMVCAGINSAEAGLFGCHKNKCCQPSCCEVQCCEPAPVCCEPAPCCEQSCCNSGCKKPCFLSKLFGGCHKKNNCCQPACDCGCGAPATCSTCGH